MRILFVTASWLPESIGGVELHLHGIARAMAVDHEVTVFTRSAFADREELSIHRYEVDGIPVTRLNYRFSDCVGFPWIYRNPNIRARFEEVLNEVRPDVVHAHHLTCLSTDLLDAAKERGIRTVFTLHDFWMGCPRGQRMTPELHLCEEIDLKRCVPCLTKMWSGWFGVGRDGPEAPAAEREARDLAMLRDYHAWVREMLLRVDQLVTPSASSRQIFARQGIPADRIAVVENGLDHAPFHGLSPRDGSGPLRFGYIGSAIPTKGVHVLLEAFSSLIAESLDPVVKSGVDGAAGDAGHGGARAVSLHIHGEAFPWHEVGGYEERLRAQAAHLGSTVTFHGRYEARELPAILSSLDVLVVPSLWFEAFCLTLREAYLAQVPVIVSDLGAMREGAVDGETALLFQPGNAADLAAKMSILREDAALRRRLAVSPKRVRTVEQNAAELLDLYQNR